MRFPKHCRAKSACRRAGSDAGQTYHCSRLHAIELVPGGIARLVLTRMMLRSSEVSIFIHTREKASMFNNNNNKNIRVDSQRPSVRQRGHPIPFPRKHEKTPPFNQSSSDSAQHPTDGSAPAGNYPAHNPHHTSPLLPQPPAPSSSEYAASTPY